MFCSSPVSDMCTAPILQVEWAVLSISESSLLGENRDRLERRNLPSTVALWTTPDKGHQTGKDSRFLRRQQEALKAGSREMP